MEVLKLVDEYSELHELSTTGSSTADSSSSDLKYMYQKLARARINMSMSCLTQTQLSGANLTEETSATLRVSTDDETELLNEDDDESQSKKNGVPFRIVDMTVPDSVNKNTKQNIGADDTFSDSAADSIGLRQRKQQRGGDKKGTAMTTTTELEETVLDATTAILAVTNGSLTSIRELRQVQQHAKDVLERYIAAARVISQILPLLQHQEKNTEK